MIIEHNAEIYRVRFKHDYVTHSHKVSGERRGRWFRYQWVLEYTPTTHCILEQRVANEWAELTRKQAVCNYSDLSVFSKEEGRKKSLEKTLNATFLHRDTRTKFWEEYGKQTNKSWSTSLQDVQEGGISQNPQP
jgi:L-rhamnose mutarotase